MPKHPKSAYLHFVADNRERVKASGSSFTDIAKRLGQKWKSLPAPEREVYLRIAEADKVRYKREKARYDLAPVKKVVCENAHPGMYFIVAGLESSLSIP